LSSKEALSRFSDEGGLFLFKLLWLKVRIKISGDGGLGFLSPVFELSEEFFGFFGVAVDEIFFF